jgi:cytochrome c oxidase subunit 3
MTSAAPELTHGELAHHFADLEQQKDAARLGMWIFLATEVMFFGGVLMVYAIYRALHLPEFRAACKEQNVILGTANTIVLICSSLTMALAVHSAETRNRAALIRFLLLTIGLGVAFLVVKGFEYHHDWVAGLVPGPTFQAKRWQDQGLQLRAAELYFTLYFIMTGLHALHMIVGIGVLGVQAVLARRGWFTGNYPTPIELTGLYWHFVDIVWIFLFPLLYLLRH